MIVLVTKFNITVMTAGNAGNKLAPDRIQSYIFIFSVL